MRFREIEKIILADGWQFKKAKGSHYSYIHPTKPYCFVTVLFSIGIHIQNKHTHFDMLAEKDSYIDSAYRQLQIISQDEQMRMEYEAREKAMRDYSEMMYEADMRGEETAGFQCQFLPHCPSGAGHPGYPAYPV